MRIEATNPRWLLLAHQLPSQPSRLRVKVWRRLQGVGAVLIRNSVYALPNSSEGREHFEWIRAEIVAQGGEATVFAAGTLDEPAEDELREAFVTARRSDWDDLRQRAAALHESLRTAGDDEDGSAEQLEREVAALRSRVAQIDRIDYFRAPGRPEALEAIERAARAARRTPSQARSPEGARRPHDYRGRRWLTRPRPGVDRMASAWLIRRFIDGDAEFTFGERIPRDEDVVPFDMFGVELGHHGERCTFETLLSCFALEEPALMRIARIVHDLDLHAEPPAEPEAATIARLVEGLRAATPEDALLLDRGMVVFEALYRSFHGESAGA